MGDEQRLTPDEQITRAREQFEAATDFTLAVEEEFAILDAETLGLVNRFEEMAAIAPGTELEEHLVGELIASEVEVRTGPCATFAEAAETMIERRNQLLELAGRLGLALCGAGTHPWSPWQEQRIIDTPHYRRNDEILRYVVWRNNTFGIHVHVAIRGPDRAIAVANAMRCYLPELLAFSASSPFVEGVYTYLHSARSQTFTKMFPRCGVPDAFDGWADFERYVRWLYATGSVTEHTQLWWSVRPHLAFPTVETRICDGQPEIGEAIALAALVYALTVRLARAVDEGEPLPAYSHRLIEENFWRAIRHGLQGDLIDLAAYPDRARVRPAREALEELLVWILPVAQELGVAPYLTVPTQNPAERQAARYAAGQTLDEIYAQEVLEVARVP
jgi:glutamate---cysteine ligase / carboxylate-amine ligase